ncbi:MAG TPA: methanogen output domain 1-containing protein [Candidatus Nanoarchaeia archaeon]|nr:methanogen output domain 1-containing protein [Candidatus Nanoarchaeia archaeon]
MLNPEIEAKIVEFIKNSPFGVTSSDIADYLSINRMTVAKYLAIIKVKAKVDFKQLGMAKLWFVPVILNKENYLDANLVNLAKELKDDKSKEKMKKAAIETAQIIEEQYRGFYNTSKLTYRQVLESLIDSQKKIGGNFTVVESNEDVIVLKNSKCPFGEPVKHAPCLCATTSALCGVMTARNLGYSKVVLKKTIAKGSDICIIYIYLKKTKESEAAVGESI